MLRSILEILPDLRAHLPTDLETLRDGSAVEVVGQASHPEHFQARWASSAIGAALFGLTAGLPEGFFAAGTYSADFEHAFAMWVRGQRRFYFRSVWAGGGWDGVGGVDLVGKARAELRLALASWSNGTDAFVSNVPFVPPGVGTRSPRPLDLAIAHVAGHVVSTGTPFVDLGGELMSSSESKLPLTTSQMRSMVMTLMGCVPEGPVDMRMVVQALAKASPANFGSVVPVTPEHLSKLEAERDSGRLALGRVRRLHVQAEGGACSACRDASWPCPTLRALAPASEATGEGSVC